MNEYKNKKIILFETQKDFEKWLDKNWSNEVGIWVEFFNKGKGKSLSYQEALETALCFGWIDGQIKKLQEDRCMRSFTPRRKGSVWSKINVGKCEELIRSGKMKPAGMAQIEAAKSDGRWERAYAGPADGKLPEDFLSAVESDSDLRQKIEGLKKIERYSIYFQLATASSPKIRQARFDKILKLLKEK